MDHRGNMGHATHTINEPLRRPFFISGCRVVRDRPRLVSARLRLTAEDLRSSGRRRPGECEIHGAYLHPAGPVRDDVRAVRMLRAAVV